MEKVRPWCGQPSDRGRLYRTEQKRTAFLLYNYVANAKMGGKANLLKSRSGAIWGWIIYVWERAICGIWGSLTPLSPFLLAPVSDAISCS